jgi:hypothetical protein
MRVAEGARRVVVFETKKLKKVSLHTETFFLAQKVF